MEGTRARYIRWLSKSYVCVSVYRVTLEANSPCLHPQHCVPRLNVFINVSNFTNFKYRYTYIAVVCSFRCRFDHFIRYIFSEYLDFFVPRYKCYTEIMTASFYTVNCVKLIYFFTIPIYLIYNI